MTWYGRTVDRGEPTPEAAAFAWLLTFSTTDDATGISRLLAAEHRDELLRQRADYQAQMTRDAQDRGAPRARLTTDGGAHDTVTVHGDRATVVQWSEAAPELGQTA